VLNNNKFTLVNVCFQHKHNEEIGIFWQALSSEKVKNIGQFTTVSFIKLSVGASGTSYCCIFFVLHIKYFGQ
jgi:hypothetical protein